LLSRLDPTAKRFILRLPFAAGGALLLWFWGLDALWGRAVIDTAETTIRAVERAPSTFVEWRSNRVVVFRRSDFGSRSDLPGFDPALMTFNLALFLGLWAATPGAASLRGLRGGLGGCVLLFASHVLHVALAIEATWATKLGAWSIWNYPRWQRELFATGNYFFDIVLRFALPFAFWGVFILLPTLRAQEEEAQLKESAPPRPKRKKKR
jgi:hypothetical protein